MKKIIDNVKKNRKHCIIVFYLIGIVLLGVIMRPGLADDAVSKELTAGYSVVEWVVYRYNVWSARFLQEATGYYMIWHPLLWKLLNSLILFFMPFIIADILDFKEDEIIYCIFGVMLYPITDMASAGWICTSITYLWPVFFAIINCSLLCKYLKDVKLTLFQYILFFSTLILACNHELLAAFMLSLIVYNLISVFLQKKHMSKLLIISMVVIICNIIFILLSPGNQSRKVAETSAWFPNFNNLTVFHKLYLGIIRVYTVLVEERNSIFLVFCIVLAISVFVFSNKTFERLIGSLPLILIFVFSSLFSYYRVGSPIKIELRKMETYIPAILGGVFLVSIMLALYLVFRDCGGYITGIVITVLCIGIATTGVMGFTPTIYASGERTSIFMLFSFIFIILLMIKRLLKSEKISVINLYYINTFITCMTVILYISNFLSVLLLHHSNLKIVK